MLGSYFYYNIITPFISCFTLASFHFISICYLARKVFFLWFRLKNNIVVFMSRLKQQTISCPNNTRAITVTLSPPNTNLTAEKRRMDFTAWTPVNGYLRHAFDVFYPDEYCFNKYECLLFQ